MTRFCLLFLLAALAVFAQEHCFTVFHTTDLHGWVNGHPHDPSLSADMGDLHDFVHHYKLAHPERTVLLVDTGDVIEGTGLSDATPIHGKYIFETLKMLPYDALTQGNHDLYHSDVINHMRTQFVPHWNGRYITTNTHYTGSGPGEWGRNHTVIEFAGFRVLVLGFLYNDYTHAPNIGVTPVEQAVQEPAFLRAMAEPSIDVVLALTHIPATASEMKHLKEAVRRHHADTPLVMLAGHSHRKRILTNATERVIIMESSCYLRVVGAVEACVRPGGAPGWTSSPTVRFIPANRSVFEAEVGVHGAAFQTAQGRAIKAKMANWTHALHLDTLEGCAPRKFYYHPSHYPGANSLYSLHIDKVWPEALDAHIKNPFYIMNTGSLRADVYPGRVTANDLFSVDPFNNQLAKIPGILGADIQQLIQLVQDMTPDEAYPAPLPEVEDIVNRLRFVYYTKDHLKNDTRYTIVTTHFNLRRLGEMLELIRPGSHPVGQDIAFRSRDIFRDYVHRHWACRPAHASWTWVPVALGAIALVIAIIILVVFILKRRKRSVQQAEYSKI